MQKPEGVNDPGPVGKVLDNLHSPPDKYAGKRDITIFVACFNEEGNIIKTLHTLLAAFSEVECDWEVIVIDDASTDRSVELVTDFIRKHSELPIYLKVNDINRGLAQNFIEGAFLGNGKYYRLVCGDHTEPKEAHVSLLKRLGDAEIVIPYQVECPGRSLLRRALSKIYTLVVNLISGYRLRYHNGSAIHLRYNVMRWHTNYRGFGFQADMITRLLENGVSYVEVPSVASEREEGTSNALTLRNFLSIAHFFFDLSVRRAGKVFFRRNEP